MTKKDYQLFADAVSQIEDNEIREKIKLFLIGLFGKDNYRFDHQRFIDWIERRRNNASMKGTRYNQKYMPLGIK